MVGSVTHEILDGICTIEFYHPKGNSLPKALLADLAETIISAGKNPKAKVIILKSTGKGAFCAGASFDELSSLQTIEESKEFFSGFAHVILAMKSCPKFILSRIHGKAVGGGVGLIAASDYALASTEAFIKLSELSIGIGPFVIAPLVERKIGVSALSTLSINAQNWKKAEWGYEKGLFNALFKTVEDLDLGIQKLALQLSKSSEEAMRELKKALWSNTQDFDTLLFEKAEITGKLALGPFTRDFLRDFTSH